MTETDRATVELKIPPRPEFFATIRAVTRSASVLADLDVSDVEELQIAVGEAATLLLPLASDGAPLQVTVEVAPGVVRLDLCAASDGSLVVDTSGMAWLMLTALDPGVQVRQTGNTTSIVVERSHATTEP